MQHVLDTFILSVTSPYNVTFALAIALMLTRFRGRTLRSLAHLALHFVVALILVWILGTVSDLVFPNSVTWTLYPTIACGLLFRDFGFYTRTARTVLLACAWMYALSLADFVALGILHDYRPSAWISFAYMLAIVIVLDLIERKGLLDDIGGSLSLLLPVVVVCASGFVSRSILYLRSDFGVDAYTFGSLPSLLMCIDGQIAEILVYYGVLRLARNFASGRRLQAERQLMESRLSALDAYRESGESLRVLRHEVKNQYAYIKLLLERGDYEKAKDFFGEMQMRANPTFLHVNTGNALVDDIVNLELSKATAAGVDIDSRIAVPPELPYDEVDLASLLMNLLDNAIEACGKLDPGKREVHLGILTDGGSFLVSVTNPAAEAPKTDNAGAFKTTKKDPELHGYGTGIVRKIADKYDGVADFSFAEGTFTAKVMLAL